jgi:phosphoribosylaminoimidazole-succinocarboxamide synthase
MTYEYTRAVNTLNEQSSSESARQQKVESLTAAMQDSPIGSLPMVYRGKVRDVHEIDDQHWLIIATDRASAFDVILPTPIPGKGKLLTALALFWFERYRKLVPNHLASIPLEDVLTDPTERDYARGRSMIVKRLDPLPVEAVVRGYIAGSGWKDYASTGTVCGHTLPAGLQLADALAEPLFTPATKAELGDHDENITLDQMTGIVGKQRAQHIERVSRRIYLDAHAFAKQRGIILADTKFEFGTDQSGELVLMDEILTPDSSRYWEADTWTPGSSPASYDKQYLRDWLEQQDWDKTAPGPRLPESVVEGTVARYSEAVARLTEEARGT